jgi:hypothetical protein
VLCRNGLAYKSNKSIAIKVFIGACTIKHYRYLGLASDHSVVKNLSFGAKLECLSMSAKYGLV